jgi:hypothetical protein
LAQTCFDDAMAEAALQEEKESVDLEEAAGDESDSLEDANASEEAVENIADEQTLAAEENDDEDEADIPVEDLVDIDPEVIQLLVNNEFQTLAELSITPLEELSAIEGISKEVAETVLKQARDRIALLENTE